MRDNRVMALTIELDFNKLFGCEADGDLDGGVELIKQISKYYMRAIVIKHRTQNED